MNYHMPLYRPPSEADSLIIQATLGCSHNRCSFCDMYKSKKFIIKPVEQIKNEIDFLRESEKDVKRVFMADGDALIIKFEDLKSILLYIKEVFPECRRVSMYGSPKSILLKSIEELTELKKLGVSLIYLGVESGDDNVLKAVNKGVSSQEIIDASLKVKEAGIKLSVTVIAGLAGKENSEKHAVNTGKLISKISPQYFSILTLMYNKGSEIYKEIVTGRFTTLNGIEVLKEIRLLIENIDSKENIIFRSNHASNYVNLEGVLPKDREKIISHIDYFLREEILISERYRRL